MPGTGAAAGAFFHRTSHAFFDQHQRAVLERSRRAALPRRHRIAVGDLEDDALDQRVRASPTKSLYCMTLKNFRNTYSRLEDPLASPRPPPRGRTDQLSRSRHVGDDGVRRELGMQRAFVVRYRTHRGCCRQQRISPRTRANSVFACAAVQRCRRSPQRSAAPQCRRASLAPDQSAAAVRS